MPVVYEAGSLALLPTRAKTEDLRIDLDQEQAGAERAAVEGDLPVACQPADLARYVFAVMQGIAVQAAGGASRAQLRRVAAIALEAWPE